MVVQRNSRGRRVVARGLWTAAELVVTLGVVLLLLVVHQLWWTNRQARAGAEHQVRALQREWGRSRGAGRPAVIPGVGVGAVRVKRVNPMIPVRPAGVRARAVPARVPRPAGTRRTPSSASRGSGSSRPSPRASARAASSTRGTSGTTRAPRSPGKPGNFALAGHRNTHGEPFRYINRLRRGDRIDVETREAVYTYTVDRTLARTSPRDGGVIAAVPRSNVKPYTGYTEAGSYVTLTTCTPEFTSRYRLVVWGRLVDVRSR